MFGTLRMFGGKALILSTSERIAPSTAVSIEHNDILFVGEVVACDKERDASWKARIKVEHTLTSLESLMRLRSALLGSPETSTVDFPGALLSS